MSVRISIVTISYNSEAVIGRTLESVLRQDYKEIEYLIVDGASLDRTVEVAEQYRRRMEEKGICFRIISEPDNGIYDAMNKGIQQANGDVIGILNSGDWYEENAIKTIAGIFEEEKGDLVFGDIRLVKKNGNTFVKKAKQRKFQTSRDWNHPTMFVRAELYKKNLFPCIGLHDDYGFYLKMRKDGARIRTIPQVLASFEMGGASNRKSIREAAGRIRDRYIGCYRYNGYSRWYLVECILIEAAKMLLG